jgi:hypothetical protein
MVHEVHVTRGFRGIVEEPPQNSGPQASEDVGAEYLHQSPSNQKEPTSLADERCNVRGTPTIVRDGPDN